jgi:hypothetical protein
MLTSDQSNLRADEQALRLELEGVGVQFRGRACRCPFHDDRTPSAGIYLDEGVWRFKCQGCGVGGDIFDIRAMNNKTTPEEELRAARQRTETPRRAIATVRVEPTVDSLVANAVNATAVYRYTNPETREADLVVARFDDANGKKRFLQGGRYGDGWAWKAPVGKLPLYNRIRIKDSSVVVVVEGEKCVHALHGIGVVATTAPGGAMNGGKADWSPLAGKTVYLWPDNDESTEQHPEGKGVSHMLEVQKFLQQLTPAPSLNWIDYKSLNLPSKGDAADLVEKCGNPTLAKSIVDDLMSDAKPCGIIGDFSKHIEGMIAGECRPLPMPFKFTADSTRMFTPKTLTCVCGDPGSGKSFWLLQSFMHAYSHGAKVAIFELEEDRNYHLMRALAMLSGDSRVTDPEWVEANGDIVRTYFASNRDLLDAVGRSIWDAPDEQPTLEQLREWIAERAREGFKLICVDPVTAATSKKDPWVADLEFVMAAKTIARQFSCCVVLVTHPKKGKKTGAMLDDLAGGAAYQRFPQTVIWIERNDAEKEAMVRRRASYPPESVEASRFLYIAKARNGMGAGKRVAFDFSTESLTFNELGPVVSAGKEAI